MPKKAEKSENKNEKETIKRAKTQALDVALASIEKQFGTGSIMKYSADSKMDVDVIPTGSFALDLALG
ncbi:MAG: DNA recombination/repair protein RecA, partial [Patescibacteria group bacterium]|nr:DNA recombination/repair protein RecA [Patescibacteria group bacterium]